MVTDKSADGTEQFVIFDDTLTSLSTADPIVDQTERYLPTSVYEKAFAAWDIAAADVFEAWQKLTNPNNLQPEIEKPFRDAAELVYRFGVYLGEGEQGELIARLSGRWGTDVKKVVREILNNEDLKSRQKIDSLKKVADDFGLSLPRPPEPLPQISKSEVRLVAWMAISKS